ncbi:MAG: preprotein translocase subunit SecY [Candidatus Onthomonas sp.]
MIETIRNAWKIQELRQKLIFVAFILLIFRLGNAIPVPFINTSALQSYFNAASSNILGLMNVMSGGAFGQGTMFALSIQPYINASIIIQLLTVAIPALERLAKDGGEEGKRTIEKITRYTTLAIALLQGFGYYTLLKANSLLADTGIWAAIVIIATFTGGAVFVMWLGEQITEFGIGNGISMLLFAGIVSRVPNTVYYMWVGVQNNLAGNTGDGTVSIAPWAVPLIVVGMLLLVVFVVFINSSERRIPVQYAKRVVGRKQYGGQASKIPMKVNMSGVLPIIFAQTIASIPATIAAFVPAWADSAFMKAFDTNSVLYAVVYVLLIVGFSYFYSTIQFNPIEVANNLKAQGGFIPGFRAGRPTAEFLSRVLNRITMFGAIYLGIIALLPIITGNLIGMSALSIGGTSVLIVVSVALETEKALEAQMVMRTYKGFLN